MGYKRTPMHKWGAKAKPGDVATFQRYEGKTPEQFRKSVQMFKYNIRTTHGLVFAYAYNNDAADSVTLERLNDDGTVAAKPALEKIAQLHAAPETPPQPKPQHLDISPIARKLWKDILSESLRHAPSAPNEFHLTNARNAVLEFQRRFQGEA